MISPELEREGTWKQRCVTSSLYPTGSLWTWAGSCPEGGSGLALWQVWFKWPLWLEEPQELSLPLALLVSWLQALVSSQMGSVYACFCFPRPTKPSEGNKLCVFRCYMGQGLGNPRGSQTCLRVPQTMPLASISLGQESGFPFPSPSFSQQAGASLVNMPREPAGFAQSLPGHFCTHSHTHRARCACPLLSRQLCPEGPCQ